MNCDCHRVYKHLKIKIFLICNSVFIFVLYERCKYYKNSEKKSETVLKMFIILNFL